MEKIKLIDNNDVPQEYENIETVTFDTADGGTQVFTRGEAVENVEIALNFSIGDQPISAPDGMLVKSAIIKKPDDLKAENIADGVTIAGIKGKHQGGGVSEIDIIPHQEVEVVHQGDGIYVQWLAAADGKALYAGKTYYIEWNDDDFYCDALDQSGDIYLGTMKDNDVLNVVYMPSDNMLGIITTKGGSHTIRVYEKSFYGLPCQLKEILPETTLEFAKGACQIIKNTPAAIIADNEAVKTMDVINDGESGIVIWDGNLYAVYASLRNTAPIGVVGCLSVAGAIGNIGIPSTFLGAQVVEATKAAGKSTEPFLIVANDSWGFIVAIPENSTKFTHTIQMFKFE